MSHAPLRTMKWWLPVYEPSDHEIGVNSLYETVDAGRRDIVAERTLLICFTNRSGSDFLAHALASTGSVAIAREYLNHPVVSRRSLSRGISSLDEYLIDLAAEFTHDGIFSLKTGLSQLYYLARLGFIGDLLPNPEFILIERGDVVAQAISWLRALQSGQWSSGQAVRGTQPRYDFLAIHKRVDDILAENYGFRAFLVRNDCPTHFVRYEELNEHPWRTVQFLADALGFADTQYRPRRVEVERQHTSLNREWKARYLAELRGT